MPQLSIYIDEETLRRVELAARTEQVSVSKYVSRKLRSGLDDEWPERFGDLFGAVSDPGFSVPEVGAEDCTREPL